MEKSLKNHRKIIENHRKSLKIIEKSLKIIGQDQWDERSRGVSAAKPQTTHITKLAP